MDEILFHVWLAKTSGFTWLSPLWTLYIKQNLIGFFSLSLSLYFSAGLFFLDWPVFSLNTAKCRAEQTTFIISEQLFASQPEHL